ncbi:MAG: gamma-glutamyltransferase [Bdellovibrionales bacterium]
MKNTSLLLLFLTACSSAPKLQTVPLRPQATRAQYEAIGSRAIVATQGTASTAAALEVLSKGGNLFDAFAAVSFAISVERPQSTGLGGGGFVLFRSAKTGKVESLDFRETAPRRAHSRMYLNSDGQVDSQKSIAGALAVATPGLVKGVLELHGRHGRLSRAEILAPAIRLAQEGFPVYPALHQALQSEKAVLARFPSSRKIFLDPQGEPWPVGHILVQADLAQTLREIANPGSRSFYEGAIAKKIVSTLREQQGLMDLQDLRNYRTKWRKPVESTYRNFQIFSQPPPSSGGTHVIQILNTLEKDQLRRLGPQHPDAVHLTASAMQRAFVDRARYMGDPDFVKIPLEKLISKSYAAEIRSQIRLSKASPAVQFSIDPESPETTHFSLMDQEGNMIASTQTINGYFGSGLVAEGTGIVLNNEMDDFSAQVGAQNLYQAVGGRNNLVAPQKRPLSSMSPTLVLKDGKPFLAVGTPSGTRIITCVTLTLLNVLEYGLPPWQAVTLARYHHQWQPDVLRVESPGLPSSTARELERRGHRIEEQDLGCRIQLVQKTDQGLHGVSDPREEGSCRGL